MFARLLLWLTGRVSPDTLRRISGLRWRIPLLRPLFERMGDTLRNRDMVIQHGPAAGIRFNSGSSMAGYVIGYMEPHILETISEHLQPGDVAYDLGANIGYLSMLMARRVGPTGTVVSFEPMPQNAAQIRHNAGLNGFQHVVVREEAVGDRDGTASFMVDAFATNHHLTEMGTSTPNPKGSIDVAIRALDSVARELPDPNFIKMDIEGAEAMAIRGGAEMLRRAQPALLIELHGTRDAVVERLEELGYTVTYVRDPGMTDAQAAEYRDNWNAHILALPAKRTATAGAS